MRSLLFVIVMAISSIVNGQQTNALEALRQSYEQQQQVLLDQYGVSLENSLATLKSKGDLDNYLIIKAERERFAAEKSVPSENNAAPLFRSAAEAYYNRTAASQEQYVKMLDQLIKQQVKASQIEAAMATKAEKEKVTTFLSDMRSSMSTKSATTANAEPASNGKKPVLLSSDFVVKSKNNYDRTGGPKPVKVPLKDPDNRWNLSLLKTATASASSVIPGHPTRHLIVNLNDGWYNNAASWVAAGMPAWAQIDLGSDYSISKVVFGSEHTPFFNDREATRFRILVSSNYNPDSNAPEWKEVYVHNGKPVKQTTPFSFPPVTCRYVRIDIAAATGPVRIDELEIYGTCVTSK